MKEFRTELIPKNSSSPIGLKDKILAIGSCFADEMSNRLAENKFQVWNYFGTVYNPISIHQVLAFGLTKELPPAESYSNNGEIHFNYHFHSCFNSLKKDEIENNIRKTIEEVNSFLKSSDRIIITYGTAFVYRLKTNNEIVANCHKMPSPNFDKFLLTESEILKSFNEFYSLFKSINPFCKIILTVSPIRHLKDTLELNSVSKSILRTSCHSIVNQFSDVEYFPAYEILLDDLRDYRFYKTDRLHPTDEAVDYIWEKFISSYFDEHARKFIEEWTSIKKEMSHKPFNPDSQSHQKFLVALLRRLENIQTQIDVSSEIQKVKSGFINHNS
ncbi:MAG: GSCFA domain-containing protein [Cyclobacteriaceae bacterium]